MRKRNDTITRCKQCKTQSIQVHIIPKHPHITNDHTVSSMDSEILVFATADRSIQPFV
jgi:hypothetical protein